jgi:hypothetical protein
MRVEGLVTPHCVTPLAAGGLSQHSERSTQHSIPLISSCGMVLQLGLVEPPGNAE